ncbi:MAG: hypothetical protein IPO62_17945 [Saprospiraceae bacterium]|nr:hypothetical protein [Saprospiraceae bacterium]
MGASTDGGTVNTDLGLEVRFNMPLAQNNLGFTGHFRFAQVLGGDKFYEGLGLMGRCKKRLVILKSVWANNTKNKLGNLME